MLAIIAAHICGALLAPFLVRAFGRHALAVLALVPGSAAGYALLHSAQVLNGDPIVEELRWIPGLSMTLPMRMDVLSWVMTLIVGTVGALVMVYASRYFSHSAHGLRRFSAVFTAFAGAMLGVVQTDHTIGLYIFWEATSVLSFLLIGHHYDRRPARVAARQALTVTTFGSLAMFAGFVIIGEMPAGSYRFSQLVNSLSADTPQGIDVASPLCIVAGVLILLGAFSKSALVPAHFWLPGAMAAPTPVSAFLHAAAMVKAGVYLVARLTPGMTQVPVWSPLVVAVGLITMLLGGWRALKQDDLKLVLAYGTVSQLGLITATVGQGSAGALTAGMTMLVAHSFFKSTLFLTVGAVESATGTREISKLSGLGRRKPVLAAAAGLAALSMAGVPLTTGYLGKEALISALLDGSAAAWSSRALDLVTLGVVVCGSILTAAYSWRAWWGAFGVRSVTPIGVANPTWPQSPRVHDCRPTPFFMYAPIVLLSCGALLGLAPRPLEETFAQVSTGLPGHAHLAWWSGWIPAVTTLGIFAVAALLAVAAQRVEVWQKRWTVPVAAADMYAWTMRELEIVAARVTRLTQRGSLPWDLSTILVTLSALTAGAMIMKPPSVFVVRFADSGFQVLIALIIFLATVETVRSRRRLRAAISLGGVGLGVALLFASQGAPDLALTLIVVEAVSIVIFVLVLRRLPRFFSDRPLAHNRWWRFAIAVTVGLGVVLTGIYASSARIHEPVSAIMANEAQEFGGGDNIVNVILVDMRAWDTVGELSVLLVIATGVASLIYVRSRSGRIDRAPARSAASDADARPLRRRVRRVPFLRGAEALPTSERSIVLEVVARLLFPTMLVLSVWILLVGHNNPGGGFIGGVIAGLAFVVRYLAGGRHELGEAMPISPGRIMGFGLFIAGAGALAPVLFGNTVLESVAVDLHLGILGDIHFTTAMILDIGVYVLVIGLILDLISATGAEIDRHSPIPDCGVPASDHVGIETAPIEQPADRHAHPLDVSGENSETGALGAVGQRGTGARR
ncbi:Na+/H+ antiporter subunit A [Schaalia sp. ZJ405]|uniref:Na+/H+ antiporter subunit A n=1 Tax=Schaalia sp. ZJ405 TaxID=2709403 RepID=UPI0018CAA498|nr:Na+/H+ antiporter subunit A [Schaalia sp. ZJ405]QPK81180.1 Na+/H+ antiporter subunit A [Schaalia sp. ZJ405]